MQALIEAETAAARLRLRPNRFGQSQAKAQTCHLKLSIPSESLRVHEGPGSMI